jgi:hypothetical protein
MVPGHYIDALALAGAIRVKSEDWPLQRLFVFRLAPLRHARETMATGRPE